MFNFKKYRTIIGSILIIFFLCLFNTANAIKFENYEVLCDIDQNNNVHESIVLEIYNNNSDEIDEITYIIPQNADNLKVDSDRGVKHFSKISKDGSTKIIIELENPIKNGEKGYINITFDSDTVWDKGDKKLLSISVPAVDSNFTMTVILPAGSSIVSPAEGLLSITPQDYTIDTDGKRIYVMWKKELNQDEKYFGATVSYAILSAPAYDVVNPNQNIYYNILVIVLVLVALGLGYGVIYQKRKNKLKIKYIEELNLKKEELIKNIGDLNSKINKLELELKNKDNLIQKLANEEKGNEDLINNLKSKLNELENELNSKNKINQKLEEVNVELSNKVNEYMTEISSLKSKLKELEDKYNKEVIKNNKLSENVDKLIKKNKEYEDIINKKDDMINELRNIINDYEKTKSEMLMNILTDEEKMVIKLIKEYKEITQKEIVEITGQTKPKVSRIVSDLEGRGIIKKVKIGRINKLTLSDELNGWL